MTYQEFIKELIERFGEEQGVSMALRAEVGFLRKHLEQHGRPEFVQEQSAMIEDFLKRHPRQ